MFYDKKVVARTSTQVVEGVAIANARHGGAGRKFLDRKISIEGMVSAILLDFLSKGFEEQGKILDTYVPLIEAQLLDEPPGEQKNPDPTEFRPIEIKRVVQPKSAEKLPRPKGRSKKDGSESA